MSIFVRSVNPIIDNAYTMYLNISVPDPYHIDTDSDPDPTFKCEIEFFKLKFRTFFSEFFSLNMN